MKPLSHNFQTKNGIKKYWFLTKLWIFENGLFLRGPKTAPSNILGCDVIWALLSKIDPFSGAYLHIEIDLNQKVLIAVKYLFDLFLCKKDGWIQKTRFKTWKYVPFPVWRHRDQKAYISSSAGPKKSYDPSKCREKSIYGGVF